MVRHAARLLPACGGAGCASWTCPGRCPGPPAVGNAPEDSPPCQPVGNHVGEETTLVKLTPPPGAVRTRRLTDTLPLTQAGHPTPGAPGPRAPSLPWPNPVPQASAHALLTPWPAMATTGPAPRAAQPATRPCHTHSHSCAPELRLELWPPELWPLTAGVRLTPSPHEDAGAGPAGSRLLQQQAPSPTVPAPVASPQREGKNRVSGRVHVCGEKGASSRGFVSKSPARDTRHFVRHLLRPGDAPDMWPRGLICHCPTPRLSFEAKSVRVDSGRFPVGAVALLLPVPPAAWQGLRSLEDGL